MALPSQEWGWVSALGVMRSQPAVAGSFPRALKYSQRLNRGQSVGLSQKKRSALGIKSCALRLDRALGSSEGVCVCVCVCLSSRGFTFPY